MGTFHSIDSGMEMRDNFYDFLSQNDNSANSILIFHVSFPEHNKALKPIYTQIQIAW